MSLDTKFCSDSMQRYCYEVVQRPYKSHDDLLAQRHAERPSRIITTEEKIHSSIILSAHASTFDDKFHDGDLFYTPRSYGEDLVTDIRELRGMLVECFIENKEALLSLVMHGFNRTRHTAGKHSIYMLSLVWLWEKHPEEFMVVAPTIEYEDLLPLLSTITFNRSFSVERLWKGFQYGTSRETTRASMIAKEKMVWQDLLLRHNVTSNDVVSTHARPSRMRSGSRFHPLLRREAAMPISSYVSSPSCTSSTPSTPCTPSSSVTKNATEAAGATVNR